VTDKKVYYVAHPYTANGDVSIEDNLRLCAERCNKLLDLGYVIISPITHSHQLHILQERSHEFWLEQDFALLKHCDGIILCPGWEKSLGCQMEITYALPLGLEILFYDVIINGGKVACRS